MIKLIIFGTGVGLNKLLKAIAYEHIKIVAIVDNDHKKWGNSICLLQVQSPDVIKNLEFDFIVIASQSYNQILQQLLMMGIDRKNLINFFSANLWDFTGVPTLSIYDTSKLSEDRLIINTMEKLGRKRLLDTSDGDYVRRSTLELMASEIYSKNLSGNVAELGVYQGGFARILNEVFSDRLLYLFDTFEGFDQKDIEEELLHDYSKSSTRTFSNTSADAVLQSMPHPENCIIKKGYFPHTTQDIDDAFSFVSIDADLFNPTYEGLKYFYLRLVKGGYILIHDYNNIDYLGVKDAVKQFCNEFGIPYFPLSDICGSVCISK